MRRIITGLKTVNNNKGSTMLEVLVSFVVLMIVLGALYSMMKFSSELRMRANDTERVTNEFERNIYKSSNQENLNVYNYYGQYDPSEDENAAKKTAFFLVLDAEKTDVEKNIGRPINYVDPEDPSAGYAEDEYLMTGLRLPNIDADGYVSTNPMIGEEHLVTPKSLTFKYHEK